MTVCLAAICEGNMLVGASDCLLTADDIQFEPQQSKIFNLTRSVAVMIAGDIALQTEVVRDVHEVVLERVQREPDNWWAVRDVAEVYRQQFVRARLRKAVGRVLDPIGLDLGTFLSQQKQMEPSFVERITDELRSFRTPSAEALIVGIDDAGAHIYVARDADISCNDLVGFAAVGSGGWHAVSQFMFSRHTKARPFAETLLLTYHAKKHAEVAPGVGAATNMFVSGPNLGSHVAVHDHVVAGLDKIYRESGEQIAKVFEESKRKANNFVEELLKSAANEQQEVTDIEDEAAGETE